MQDGTPAAPFKGSAQKDQTMTKRTYLEIAAEYAPYNTMPEFNEGTTDYLEGRYEERYHRANEGLKAQAWDRGMEAASRFTRQYL